MCNAKVDNIYFSIAEKPILKGVSAEFCKARIHGIIGPNGSGKTTLLKNLCRIWKPQQGRIFIGGRDYSRIPRKELSRIVTLVPQDRQITFPISVYDVVAMGRNPHAGRFQSLNKQDRGIIDRALHETHCAGLRQRNINELSGGERQLALIARSLATEAEIVLLDEPTSELDILHTLQIMDLLVRLKAQGKSVVVNMHDLNLAKKYCDTIAILHEGQICFSGDTDEAFSETTIRGVFGVNLLKLKDGSRMYFDFSIS